MSLFHAPCLPPDPQTLHTGSHLRPLDRTILSLAYPKGAFLPVPPGAKIAQYAGRHLHKYIIKRPEYQEENSIVDALQQGFLALDAAMQEEETLKDELAGTTAISIIIKNEKLYCANVGDSRAIACIAGHVNPLSFDHKPSNEDEAKRINAAGGWVELNRVNGNLALSRALGDFVFKKNEKKRPEEQIVSGSLFLSLYLYSINK
ncbi:hypothetical protein J6590_046866 [Homalodisca vitripennis]|nr:hypothetical protein J6590_046866 [Homalodisca vitripennis]